MFYIHINHRLSFSESIMNSILADSATNNILPHSVYITNHYLQNYLSHNRINNLIKIKISIFIRENTRMLLLTSDKLLFERFRDN